MTRHTQPAPPTAEEALTVVVPVYNEGDRIESVIAGLSRALTNTGLPFEIQIVDDGSTDWTADRERRLLKAGPVSIERWHPNAGKGAVVNRVLPRLDTTWTVIIDADNEYAPDDLLAVLEPLQRGEADWVLGSRYGFGRPRPAQYRATYLVNRVISRCFTLLSGRRIQDLLTGLYAFRTGCTSGIRLREARFAYTPELMWKVLRSSRVRLAEVPIGYRFRSYAEGKKIRWWETATILLAIVRYRFSRPTARTDAP